MNIGIIYLVIYLACIAATRWGVSKLFVKAGEEGWKAWVPIYSEVIWVKLIGKPIWWVALKCIPVARTLIRLSMNIETAKAFGRYDFKDHALAVLLPFYYFPTLGLAAEKADDTNASQESATVRRRTTTIAANELQPTVYLGPPATHRNLPVRSSIREWGDAILYAGTAAMIIRSLFLEAFMIPTTSMEKTLLAGDFLFVSKFHFGVRMPMIPLAFPFVHNKMPIIGTPSYISSVKLPYYRLPGLKKVEANDIVVFNYPGHDAHELNDGAGKISEVSMKENYIKRCVAVAGDVIELKLGQLYVNGKPAENPENYQFTYEADGAANVSAEKLEELGFRLGDPMQNQNVDFFMTGPNHFRFSTTPNTAKEMQASGLFQNFASTVIQKPDSFMGLLYPNWYNESRMGTIKAMEHNNLDNFGPLELPAKGKAITITAQNYPLYKRCIVDYEGHTVEQKGNDIVIDGKNNQFIPKMDYYWMMGDNRHNSEDSRFWGFVPEDHIIGTPVLIFFSAESFLNPKSWRLGRIGTGKIK